MKLEASVDIPFPIQTVFETYRDKLPDLLPYLPNVRDIQVVSREDKGKVTELLNKWKGGGDIPKAARKFVSDELLQWDDYATWNEENYSCHWKSVVNALKEAIHSEGDNTFVSTGPDSTRLVIKGEIKVDGKKVKGVPKLLAGTIGAAVEGFLVATVKPNLVAVGNGLSEYLKEHPKG